MVDCKPGTEFVFKKPNGEVVGKAKNLRELVGLVRKAPMDALLYHVKGQHFVPWLMMLGENDIASRVKMLRADEKTIRADLVGILKI